MLSLTNVPFNLFSASLSLSPSHRSLKSAFLPLCLSLSSFAPSLNPCTLFFSKFPFPSRCFTLSPVPRHFLSRLLLVRPRPRLPSFTPIPIFSTRPPPPHHPPRNVPFHHANLSFSPLRSTPPPPPSLANARRLPTANDSGHINKFKLPLLLLLNFSSEVFSCDV